MSETISTYETERREKVQKLRELGVDPFGSPTTGVTPLAQIKAMYQPDMGHDGGPVVKAAGRVMLKRDMGKLSFLSLRDESGDLQVALDKRRLDETAWAVRDLIDLGDLITVEGQLGTTKKGEVTVWASTLSMAAKALLPPPAKWEGLADLETRYRQRYVDLWANPEVMKLAKLRSAAMGEIRRYLTERGFLEVETPMMQPIAGGAAARPFVTHHNALDIPLYLRIAPELYLKRLLVGGIWKVFEINRNFRNEGISPRHNPEFTMLEAYEAFGSWQTMADLVEGLICNLAEKFFGGLTITHPNGRTINLQRPWRRVRLVDLIEERTGWRFDKRSLLELDQAQQAQIGAAIVKQQRVIAERAVAAQKRDPNESPAQREADIQNLIEKQSNELVSRLERLTPAEQLQEMYEKLIEPTLIDPCFVTHVPSVIIPLAKKNPADPYFADVYELAINGQEISPGYSELNDPEVQAANFADQVGDAAEQQKQDDDFLTAMRYGMPPAGGLGLGIDRLLMMLTGAESIRDVILFPLMKPL